MLRRDSATPRQYMSERFRMWDRMVLPHSVCRHQEFVKASRRESYGTHGTQVLTEPRFHHTVAEQSIRSFTAIMTWNFSASMSIKSSANGMKMDHVANHEAMEVLRQGPNLSQRQYGNGR